MTFKLAGFRTVKQTTRVSPSETITINPTLAVSTVSETVTVVGQANAEFGQTAEVQTNFKQDLIEKLPTNRTFVAAALLAPGVQNTGPNGGLSINGAMSFESLYVVNGVVVNENIRGQAERALHRGRAPGDDDHDRGRLRGVRALPGRRRAGHHQVRRQRVHRLVPHDLRQRRLGRPDPLPERQPHGQDAVPTRKRPWAGRSSRTSSGSSGRRALTGNRVTTGTTFATARSYEDVRNQKRFEGKLTFSLTTKHTFKGAYTKIKDTEDGNSFGAIMDFDSLVNGRATPQQLISANYTGIVSPKFFIEAQYSQRKFTFENSGSLFTDLVKGTLLIDQSRGNARYNSPTFCGVCDPEKRDNQNIMAKATYFAVHGQPGGAQPGGRLRPLRRQALREQPPVRISDYRVLTTSAIIQGTTLFPVLDDRTIIRWTPIFVGSEGNRFRTYSGFVNDAWTLNRHVTFNLGLRYDKNDGEDSQGRAVVKDSAISPRLSATFDPKGDGAWTVNAAYAQYVAAIANSVGDGGSAGGQPATIDFDYLGPPVNVGNPANPVGIEPALNTLFGLVQRERRHQSADPRRAQHPRPERAHQRHLEVPQLA